MATLNIAIIGRPNVGKSSLFNRLFGRKRALVHDLPGVTRDRLEEKVTWEIGRRKVSVNLIDTGGLGGEQFQREIEIQVNIALQIADAVLLLFDGQTGITAGDREVLEKFQKAGLLGKNAKKPRIIAVVNKVDTEKHEEFVNQFYELGIDPLISISAEHNRGIDELKDELISYVVDDELSSSEPHDEAVLPKIAIVGRPNTGKSTFVNALLGKNRMITSSMPGTTIDSIDSIVEINDKKLVVIDTAGIRRKSKTERGVEVLSVVMAKKALERCDVAVLMLDGETGISDQDEKIGGLIEDVGCGVVLILNKWDTQRKNQRFTKEAAAEQIRAKFGYLKYAPILFASGKERRGFEDLPDLIEEILNQRRVKISTHELTEWVRDEATVHNPMEAKFYFCHHTGRNPPTFVCHVSDPEKVDFSLKRHLINAMRARWGFMGSPIRFRFVKSEGAKSR